MTQANGQRRKYRYTRKKKSGARSTSEVTPALIVFPVFTIATICIRGVSAASGRIVVTIVVRIASVLLPGMRVIATVAVVAAVTSRDERAPLCFEVFVSWVILVVISAHD